MPHNSFEPLPGAGLTRNRGAPFARDGHHADGILESLDRVAHSGVAGEQRLRTTLDLPFGRGEPDAVSSTLFLPPYTAPDQPITYYYK
jgi:hypothetical protein